MVPNGVPEMNSSTTGLLGSFLKKTISFVMTSSGSGVRSKPGPMSTAVSVGSKVTLIVPVATGDSENSMV